MRQSLEVRDVFLGQVLQSSLQPGISYRLEHKLGEGATAVAYLSRRQGPDGEWPAVIKIIQPHVVKDSGERALTIIKKEAVALGRLNERLPPTPFVVRLLDTGDLGFKPFGKALELPWIALEYVHGGVEGTTLQERVLYSVRETGFAFDPTRAARVIHALTKGMDEIHAVGVVHRDAHPGNVLCCGAGETELFKISDFGVSRPMGLSATFGSSSLGTPGFIAPEQFDERGVVGPLCDLFSLAAIAFYVLTGENLFEGRSAAAAVASAKASERRSLLDVPTLAFELREREAACQALDLALARATSLNPKDRPQSGKLFADSLLPWLSLDPNTARPSRRWMSSIEALRSREMVLETNWTVRHPPRGRPARHERGLGLCRQRSGVDHARSQLLGRNTLAGFTDGRFAAAGFDSLRRAPGSRVVAHGHRRGQAARVLARRRSRAGCRARPDDRLFCWHHRARRPRGDGRRTPR
jgi:eukaryotic-like serine/threonine-protein kinase